MGAIVVAGLFWWHQWRLSILAPRDLSPLVHWIGAEDAPCTLLIAGDSRIAEWAPTPPAGWRVARLAFPGEAAGNIASAVIRALPRLDPDALVVLAGTNDATASAFQTAPGARATIASAEGSIAEIFAAARRLQIAVRVVMTIPPPARTGLVRTLLTRGRDRKAMQSLSRAIRDMAPAWGADVLDAEAILAGTGRNVAPELARDALHWTPQAYRLLEQELWPMLAQQRCG